ncbi:hypothetical protein IAT40_004403 [Kwoniella sp. CBS 6097]
MSILTPGVRCSACPLVDFLPLTCQYCALPYCSNHIGTHQCSAEAGPSNSARAVGKLDRGKKACELAGCERESIESIAGLADDTARGENIARQVRCDGCGGAYCVSHRSQESHKCSAPLDFNERHDAFLVRREKARELIAQRFPEHAGKVIAKPPPPKDVVKVRPATNAGISTRTSSRDEAKGGEATATSSKMTPTSDPIQASATKSTSTPTSTPSSIPAGQPKTKSKADKLWDIHLRKIRSSAEPLLKGKNSHVGDSQGRRFFEWTVDLSPTTTGRPEAEAGAGGGRVKVGMWLKNGKIEGEAERVWVPEDMPVGKIMDLLIAQSNASRSSPSDPSQLLNLLCLYPLADGSRQVKKLDLSKSASGEIVEGGLVVLVKGDIV